MSRVIRPSGPCSRPPPPYRLSLITLPQIASLRLLLRCPVSPAPSPPSSSCHQDGSDHSGTLLFVHFSNSLHDFKSFLSSCHHGRSEDSRILLLVYYGNNICGSVVNICELFLQPLADPPPFIQPLVSTQGPICSSIPVPISLVLLPPSSAVPLSPPLPARSPFFTAVQDPPLQ